MFTHVCVFVEQQLPTLPRVGTFEPFIVSQNYNIYDYIYCKLI